MELDAVELLQLSLRIDELLQLPLRIGELLPVALSLVVVGKGGAGALPGVVVRRPDGGAEVAPLPLVVSAPPAPPVTAAPAVVDKPAAPAVAAPRAPSAPGLPRALRLSELTAEQRRELPSMSLGGSVWSDSALSRFVIVNGQVVREGETAAPGVVVENIGPKSVQLRWRELRIELAL